MKKTLVYIIAALISIALAFGLFTMFREQTKQQLESNPNPAEGPAPVEMVPVIVADTRIPADTEITEAMLITKEIPITEKPFFALANAAEAVGTTAKIAIEADTVISLVNASGWCISLLKKSKCAAGTVSNAQLLSLQLFSPNDIAIVNRNNMKEIVFFMFIVPFQCCNYFYPVNV